MTSHFGIKILAGAVALAIGGAAMANTNLDGTTTGDLFLNIVDNTNNTSFLFDTGVSQALFNGSGKYSYTLSTDPNYQAFVAAEKSGDSIDYSVLSATKPTTASETIDFTSSIGAVTTQSSTAMAGAASSISSFLIGANSIASTTANSANLSGTFEYGTALNEGTISKGLLNVATTPYADGAAIGTALGFYNDAASRSGITANSVAFAGTWNLSSAGVLSYGGAAAVPLPTPMLLLLSGLGLMGVVARRNKTA